MQLFLGKCIEIVSQVGHHIDKCPARVVYLNPLIIMILLMQNIIVESHEFANYRPFMTFLYLVQSYYFKFVKTFVAEIAMVLV